MKHAHVKKLPQAMPEAVERVRSALAAEGFGVLSEIDVQATLKKKLGVDRKPFLILGACNPQLAHQALETDPSVGVFLPCNVDVYVGEDGATYVQTPRPEVLLAAVENAAVRPFAEEVNARLLRVLERL